MSPDDVAITVSSSITTTRPSRDACPLQRIVSRVSPAELYIYEFEAPDGRSSLADETLKKLKDIKNVDAAKTNILSIREKDYLCRTNIRIFFSLKSSIYETLYQNNYLHL